jgi:hypothetical protein
MYFDGSVMKEGAGVGLVFISPLGVCMEYLVQRAHSNPRSRVLHAATSSSSLAPSPASKVAGYGVQVSSRA